MSIEDEAPLGAMFYSRTNTKVYYFKEDGESTFRWCDKYKSWDNCTGLVSYRFLFDIKTKTRLVNVKKYPYVKRVKPVEDTKKAELDPASCTHKIFKYKTRYGIVKLFSFFDIPERPYIYTQDGWVRSSINKKLASRIKRECNLLIQ